MFLLFLILSAVLFSSFVTTKIKGWIFEYIIEPELYEMEMKQVEEASTSLFMASVGLVLLNNLIPFTLGAAIGLYAIL